MDKSTASNLRRLSDQVRRLDDRIDDVVDKPMEDELVNSAMLVKVTGVHSDSPTGVALYYVGDVYGNGPDDDQTEYGVTIRIPGIGIDMTLPSYGTWADLPISGAMKVITTWNGALTEHENDAVYVLVGDLILR